MPVTRDLFSPRDLCGPIPALTSVIGLILPCHGVHSGYRWMDPIKRIPLYGYHPVDAPYGYHRMDTIRWIPSNGYH